MELDRRKKEEQLIREHHSTPRPIKEEGHYLTAEELIKMAREYDGAEKEAIEIMEHIRKKEADERNTKRKQKRHQKKQGANHLSAGNGSVDNHLPTVEC